jgi:hypothetical protein
MEVIPMPKRGIASAERQVAIQEAGATSLVGLSAASQKVKDAIEAGVVSRRMLFPENAPPRSVETWSAPIIRDKAIGAAIWSRLAELDAWMSPAPRPELMSRILVLLAHYRSSAHADAVEQGIADDWAEDLAPYPMWAIEQAARTWRRTKKFKPQISEIIELCQIAVSDLSLEQGRLQAIVDASARARNPLATQTQKIATQLFKTIE